MIVPIILIGLCVSSWPNVPFSDDDPLSGCCAGFISGKRDILSSMAGVFSSDAILF